MKKFYIYYHRDPREECKGWKKYIGKGQGRRAFHINNRYAKHKNWINHLKSLGLEPIIEIVEYFDKEEDVFNREMELIKKYKEKGYDLCNMSDGGEGVSGICGENAYWYGKKRSQETKDKLSKAHTGKKHTKEHILNMRKGRKGVKPQTTENYVGNTNKLDKTHTDEFKEVCRQRMKSNTHRRRAVKCLNNGVVYESVVKACEELSLDNRSVHRVLKGEWKHTKKYKFEYFI